ncbi:hypothetical protein JNUCC76_00485 [Leuconostoc sp. JNUCC 76]
MTRQTQGAVNCALPIGSAESFRLFQLDLGSQIGWYLPFAILGLITGWFGFTTSTELNIFLAIILIQVMILFKDKQL